MTIKQRNKKVRNKYRAGRCGNTVFEEYKVKKKGKPKLSDCNRWQAVINLELHESHYYQNGRTKQCDNNYVELMKKFS